MLHVGAQDGPHVWEAIARAVRTRRSAPCAIAALTEIVCGVRIELIDRGSRLRSRPRWWPSMDA